MLLVLALCGCESADEKAERLRLENLYALDDLKVAQAYKKADFAGAAYAKEYLEIKRECAKEQMVREIFEDREAVQPASIRIASQHATGAKILRGLDHGNWSS